MDNVIEFNEFAVQPSGASDESCCWICQKANALRALFCQHCGTIQPVRALDAFARLGLERRIDVDLDVLTRQHAMLSRTLSPERFVLRGMGERGHAAKQLEAVEEAYQILRDPIKRSRYWLGLHGQKTGETPESSRNPLVSELRQEMNNAALAAQCDRVAQKAGQAMEQGIVSLMQALRAQNWPLAMAILSEVDGLEGILGDVRSRRAGLPGGVDADKTNADGVTWMR